MYVSISHHAVARGLITYSTHYSGAFYCHNRLFYLTLLSLVDSLFSLSLISLSHTNIHIQSKDEAADIYTKHTVLEFMFECCTKSIACMLLSDFISISDYYLWRL